jgi:hypothetical protein
VPNENIFLGATPRIIEKCDPIVARRRISGEKKEETQKKTQV